MPKTLRRTLTWQIAAVIVCLLLVGGAGLWGLQGLKSDFGAALAGYQQLRDVYEIGSHVQAARFLLTGNTANPAEAIGELRKAQVYDLYLPADGSSGDNPARQAVRQTLDAAVASAEKSGRLEVGTVDALLGPLADLDVRSRQAIQAAQAGAAAKRRASIIGMSILLAVAAVGATVIGVAQYRAVMRPLGRLNQAVKRIAGSEPAAVLPQNRGSPFSPSSGTPGEGWVGVRRAGPEKRTEIETSFSLPAPTSILPRSTGGGGKSGVPGNLASPSGTNALDRFAHPAPAEENAEFAELAGNINRMAGELGELYRDLQAKVDAKSRQLLQSQRLASLGYLAAGVAHEINNPLGIMTAHAELAIAAVRRGDPAAGEECRRAMDIICQEAFRCKAIVRKLLSLARGSTAEPEVVSLGRLAREAVTAIAAMPECRERNLQVMADGGDDSSRIRANPDEIRQVLLNLLMNAMEATEPGGNVIVNVERKEAGVELTVSDDGRGIPAGAMERIFEPFFTDVRGKSAAGEGSVRGTGLGLAIAQAVVHRHGGEIRASSGGRFSPSSGTPGEGWGGGLIRKPCEEPPPLPSPGVPEEGKKVEPPDGVTDAQDRGATFTVLFPPADLPAKGGASA